MGGNLENYLRNIEIVSPGISSSIQSTVNTLIPQHIKTFSFSEHLTGLLLGHVQSGKTSQVLGIISAAADEGFSIFIFLTTDNVYLHEQTLKRASHSLEGFVVCGEDDDLKFIESKIRKPVLIVIKKNSRVLKRWKDNLSSSKFCEGRPIFIIDDEGDAASLNTKVNQRQQSTINRHLEEVKKLANSSMYMQVTATPQSLFLQAALTGWKPSFVHYFQPGPEYLGGDFFYRDPPSPCIRLTPENELDDLRDEEKIIAEGLRLSLLSFLITGAHLILSQGANVCNFLVHPSVRITDHASVATKLGEYLNELLLAVSENKMKDCLRESWKDLNKTKTNLTTFEKIHDFLKLSLNEEVVKIFVMNSIGSSIVNCSQGMNIIVGGNSLGRGITFPVLQTVYYCRTAKAPQADTFWQHCRMFGYDRDPNLSRVFLPASLFKLFTELNNGNRALIGQITGTNVENISLLYPPGIKPTRRNVIDSKVLDVIVGGVNYFPNFPRRKHVEQVDEMLVRYENEGINETTLNGIITLLEHFESELESDWSNKVFINCLKALKAISSDNKSMLIVRRNRSIAKATGTLLSSTDRELGETVTTHPLLTLYRINGEKEKGWEGFPLWIPNIKLPNQKIFYKVE